MAATATDDTVQLLRDLQRANPEWDAWLSLQEEALGEVDHPAWDAIGLALAEEREIDAPLLDGATITVDGRRVRQWLEHFLGIAAETTGREKGGLSRAGILGGTPLPLLEAAVCQDEEVLALAAQRAGVEPELLGSVMGLAAAPLLQACGRALADHKPERWPHGYCWVCGAWAALAETRGLERERRLRCGRCGAGWPIDLARCAYCREYHHRNLGSLVPEEGGEARRVDTCEACKGYTKNVATLASWPPTRVALEDLASVDLDMVALERGYGRPTRPGYVLRARLAESTPARRGLRGWLR